MIITTETDPQKLNPLQLVYNKYKTYKTFWQQIIDLSDILKHYIKHYKLKEKNYLFGLKPIQHDEIQNPISINSVKYFHLDIFVPYFNY